jgi:hypothetical protein
LNLDEVGSEVEVFDPMGVYLIKDGFVSSLQKKIQLKPRRPQQWKLVKRSNQYFLRFLNLVSLFECNTINVEIKRIEFALFIVSFELLFDLG